MARLVRAIWRGTMLNQMARTSRAMTARADRESIFSPDGTIRQRAKTLSSDVSSKYHRLAFHQSVTVRCFIEVSLSYVSLKRHRTDKLSDPEHG
jgi:hypothetical protein